MRSQVVKFRVSKRTKEAIQKFAMQSQTTVSDLYRDMTYQITVGRSINDTVRADMTSVRQLANLVLACADEAPDASHAARLTDAARRLRDLASRHLGAAT